MRVFRQANVREPLRAHLATRKIARVPAGSGKESAVLIPLFEKDGAAHVWMVRRAEGLRSHGGQIAFPGGKKEASDASLLDAALREAEEEVGLARKDVDVLGGLDEYVTITGFVIAPYVAWVPADVKLVAAEVEVARVFAAPLDAFLAPPTGVFPRVGFRIDGEFVWGATAAIARDLVGIARDLVG